MPIKNIKIVLIDDSPLVLNIIKKGLAVDPSIEVVATAENGEIGLKVVEQFNPDVIVLDLEMPRMNGLEFLKRLMPNNPKPVIVVSSLTKTDSRITQDVFEAGAIDFLSKPNAGGPQALQTMITQLWTKIKLAPTKSLPRIKLPDKPMAQQASQMNNLRSRTDRLRQSVLGMGALDVSVEEDFLLKIFALGSCVGTAIFSQDLKGVAMAHVVLPSSATDPIKAKALPGYFADTAVPYLVAKLRAKIGTASRLFAKIAGGAKTSVDVGDYFGVGQKNVAAVKDILSKMNITLLGEDTGGVFSRTASVRPGYDRMTLFLPERGTWEI